MKKINLLRPPDAPPRRKEGGISNWHSLTALSGVALLFVFGACTLHLRSLDRECEQMRVSIHEASEQSSSLISLQQVRDSKQAQLAAACRLQDPLRPDVTLALLSRSLPEGVTLSELTLTTETTARPAGRSAAEGSFASSVVRPRVSLNLSGWADEELMVSETLERINAVQVLGEARIVASHPDATGRSRRQVFQITSSIEWGLSELPGALAGAQP